MDIISYFKTQLPFSQEDADKLNALFRKEQYSKGEIILMPDNHSKKIIFVEQGLIRLYYQKNDKDITFLFRDENSFSAPVESIIYNRPSPYGWEVLENCTIRSVIYHDFELQLSKIPTLEALIRLVLIENLTTLSDKLIALQFQTAEQRYNYMIERFPNILLRAPLGHIASYLGITQQTLSVIRGKTALK